MNVADAWKLRPVVARRVLFPRPTDATSRKTPVPATRWGRRHQISGRWPVYSRLSRQRGRTVSACGPFAPWLASKVTRWFSSSVRNPSD